MKPEIRFNGFSDEWVEKKLGEILEKGGSGGTPASGKSEYYDGEIPFLSISDLSKSDVYVNETLKSITELGLNNSSAWIVPKNAISLAMYASVGKVGILSKPMATSQAFYNMVFDSIETGMFVYQWLTNRYIMNGWRKDISTGTQPNLNAQIVKSTFIQLPTLPEQQKIGSLFSKYDAIIALSEQKLAELNALKKGMLERMFPKNGAKVPELRFRGFAGDWEERKFGNVVHRRTKMDNNFELPHLQFEDVRSNYGFTKSSSELINDPRKGVRFYKDDVLFGKLRPYLNKWVYSSFDGIALGDFWVFYSHDVSSGFLYNFLQTSRYMSIANMTSGTKMPRSNWSLVSNVNISVPSPSEQQKIGQLFEKLDADIAAEQVKIDWLKEQKKGLLQRVL